MALIDLFKISNFRLQFKDQRLLELMITETSLPGFTLGELTIGRPVVSDHRPGDSLTFNDLSVTCLCDEDLNAYKQIYDYLVLSANPRTGRLEIKNNVFESMLFLTTNKNNLQHTITFHNSFLKNVGDLQLSAASNEEEQITFTLDVGYTHYTFS